MKRILLSALFLIPLFAYSQKEIKPGSVKYLDHKRSFKEITLGAPISTIEDYIVETSDSSRISPGLVAYDVVDPDMKKVSDLVEIREITVLTFEDKIAYIFMKMDKPNGSKLHDLFSEAYGRGVKHNQFMDEYIWRGRSVQMMLDYHGGIDDSLIMVDTDLRAKAETYASQKNKQALGEF